jgi:hypothetical protein
MLPPLSQAEQDVLGPNEAVIEQARLFLSQDEDPPRTVGEALPWPRNSCPPERRPGRWLDVRSQARQDLKEA